MIERTLAIIKPDAFTAKVSGAIIQLIELNKFSIVRMEKRQLSRQQAELFYDIHKDKPFFKELVDYVISGPSVLLVLEQENAIKNWRDLMGATNPANAAPGTMRKMFGKSLSSNATHGSDAPETAQREIKLFFPDL